MSKSHWLSWAAIKIGWMGGWIDQQSHLQNLAFKNQASLNLSYWWQDFCHNTVSGYTILERTCINLSYLMRNGKDKHNKEDWILKIKCESIPWVAPNGLCNSWKQEGYLCRIRDLHLCLRGGFNHHHQLLWRVCNVA